MLSFVSKLILITFTIGQHMGDHAGHSSDNIVGKWKGEGKPNHHSEFFLAKDGLYYGKILFENGETKNLGKVVFKKIRFDSAKNIYKGKMCQPDADSEIDATITFIGLNKLKIVLRKNFISKTIYFLRIK